MYKYEEKAKKNMAIIPYALKQRFKPDYVIQTKQGIVTSSGTVVGEMSHDCATPQKEVHWTAAGYGAGVVQRLVGFEFQSLGNSDGILPVPPYPHVT